MPSKIQAMPRRRRNVAVTTTSAPQATPTTVNLPSPPITQGVDAVVAWLNRVNMATMELASSAPLKHKALQSLIAAFGRCRAVARDVELLLRAREQRDGVAAAVGYEEAYPDADQLAVPLWASMELIRLAQLVLAAPELDREDVTSIANRVKHYVALVTVRESAATADFKRRHRIGSDVAGAVEGYAQVQAQLEAEALTARDAEEARVDLISYGKFMKSDFEAPWHIQVIADALMRAERREVKGIILNIPPRHGKTTIASELFASWYAGKHPNHDVIVGSMSAEFAENNIGGPVRNLIQSPEFRRVFPGVNIMADTSAKGAFRIFHEQASVRQRRGMFKSLGRTGSPTGAGAHLLVLDDFISEDDAYSHTERAHLFEQIFRFRSRLAPNALWIVINTRYHEDDVVGVVQKRYGDDRKWEVISLPVYAERDEVWEITRPATPYRPAERKVFHRGVGEILWPFRQNDVEDMRRVLMKESPQIWSGQFMCRPVAESGAMIDVKWFRRYDFADIDDITKRAVRVVVSCDLGGTRLRATSSTASRTAITVWAELEDGRVYLVEVRAEPWIYPDILKNIKEVCNDWRPTDLLVEDKAAGIEAVVDLDEARDWVRTPVTPIMPVGPKETRMAVASPQIRGGQVYVPAQTSCADVISPRSAAPPWVEEFLHEIMHFPLSTHKDRSDATSQFLNWRRENSVFSNYSDEMSSSEAKQQLQRALAGPFGRKGFGVAPRQRVGAVVRPR